MPDKGDFIFTGKIGAGIPRPAPLLALYPYEFPLLVKIPPSKPEK